MSKIDDLAKTFIRNLKATPEYKEMRKKYDDFKIVFNFTDNKFYKRYELIPNSGFGDVTITMDEKDLFPKPTTNRPVYHKFEDNYVVHPEEPYLRIHKNDAEWLDIFKVGKTFCCPTFRLNYDRDGLIQNTFEDEEGKYVISHFDGCDRARQPISHCPFCGADLKQK